MQRAFLLLLFLSLVGCGSPRIYYRLGPALPLNKRSEPRPAPTTTAALPPTSPAAPLPAPPLVVHQTAQRAPLAQRLQRVLPKALTRATPRPVLPPRHAIRQAASVIRQLGRRPVAAVRTQPANDAWWVPLAMLGGALLAVVAVFGVLISLLVGTAASVQTWLGALLLGIIFFGLGALIMWLGPSEAPSPAAAPPASVAPPPTRTSPPRTTPAPENPPRRKVERSR